MKHAILKMKWMIYLTLNKIVTEFILILLAIKIRLSRVSPEILALPNGIKTPSQLQFLQLLRERLDTLLGMQKGGN
jgi:hypothetical protein